MGSDHPQAMSSAGTNQETLECSVGLCWVLPAGNLLCAQLSAVEVQERVNSPGPKYLNEVGRETKYLQIL